MKEEERQLLEALYRDRALLVRAQLGRVVEELVERQLISAEMGRSIAAELRDLGTIILQLSPEHDNVPDLNRPDRLLLEKERRELTKELRAEQREAWRDFQLLRRELRELERELAQQRQQQHRLSEWL